MCRLEYVEWNQPAGVQHWRTASTMVTVPAGRTDTERSIATGFYGKERRSGPVQLASSDGSADVTTTSSPCQLAPPIRHAACVGEKASRDHRAVSGADEKGVE